MQLASAAIGGTVGGGTGASTALAGDAFNRALHPGGSEDAAIAALEKEGYSEEELRAVACVLVPCLDGRDLTEGTPLIGGGDIEPTPFMPAPPEGYIPAQQGVNGNNMTFYNTMLGRVVTIGVSGICATAECVMKGGNYNMADPRTRQYLSDVSHAQLKFMATVTSFAVGGVWTGLAKEAAIPSWMAYSGAGVTSAGANAGAQYLTTGTVRAPDVIFAGATGTFAGWATRLPGWQAPLSMMIVNAGGAAANTVVDNAVYGESENVGDAIFNSGLGTVGGYKIGNYAGNSNINPWIINSVGAFSSEFITRKSDEVLKRIQSEQSAVKNEGESP